MDEVRGHLKKFGVVHLFWVMVILGLCCIALLVYSPDADKVNSFISFAATITSLFLAIIAIFYSMVANSDLTASLGKASQGAENISRLADRVSQVTERLDEKSESLEQRLALVPTAIDTLRFEIVQRIDAFAQPGGNDSSTTTEHGKIQGTVAGALGLYALAKAHQLGTNVNLRLASSQAEHYVRGIVLGSLSCIQILRPCNIRLTSKDGMFSIDDIGSFDIDKWASYDVGDKSDLIKRGQDTVDKMISNSDEDGSEAKPEAKVRKDAHEDNED